ncbi:ABC transporter like protein [Arabidopsis thaliana]|nr:ABC transporter like protein [Arabidopsis thaliana]CAB78565.1 ABC transporter like protein [Arabidopsis thaliana]
MKEISRMEKLQEIIPDPAVDAYMKILGLDICADTRVGDATRPGISGGEKRRLTTGELVVGPATTLFMDEISNGLDSSTTFQIVSCLQQLAHIAEATILISLLQPAPETFELFDDVILMGEGKIIYHAPRADICRFFEEFGFKCPERKGVADFLQEIMSKKDQEQYWCHRDKPYSYISVDSFINKFKESNLGLLLKEELSKPFNKSQTRKDGLCYKKYSLGKWEMLKACSRREFLLMKRNSFIYLFKSALLVFNALVTMTVFLQVGATTDSLHGNYLMGSLFTALFRLLADGLPELTLTISRLGVFCKQKDLYFYPAWAYAIPSIILKIPLSPRGQKVLPAVPYLIYIQPFLCINVSRYCGNLSHNYCFHNHWSYFHIGSLIIWWLRYSKIGLRNDKISFHIFRLFFIGKIILPFKPLTVTFQNVQYYIETPQGKTRQLLSDITGALKPGVLTSLMGVSGAGKTTLLDVLSGRKTRGIIKGEIKVGGYPKVQETFARVSGYCEQFDIHSPNITVEESLKYSAWLRLPYNIDSKTKNVRNYTLKTNRLKEIELVKEVLETVELDDIKDSVVGLPGISGLSIEQRKRLTIAVELVANPSIIFMDEPTTGLDARAAAIVMRAVKNVAETGRTVVCTIHQPSIDIFETFDELILMKNGGQLVYYGPPGQNSSKVIEYFENKMVVEQLSSASLGSEALRFPSQFSQTAWVQLKACLWKQHYSYWRNPSHNITRIVFILLDSTLCGLLFWQKAEDINNQQDLISIFGSMYTLVVFPGMNNCAAVINFIAAERNVFYRERFARMYSSWAYSFSQVLIEVPYSLLQSLLCTIIVYPTIGYHMSVYKMFWSLYSIFCSLLIFNYSGMLMVALTPNIHMAVTLRSSFFSMLNLFAGFVIPKQKIPKWWIWMYYLSPTSWVLEGLLSSQYGDVDKEILVFGEKKRVSAFLEDYFGYKHESLAVVAFVLIAYPIIVATLFAFFMSKLSFQKK